MILDDLIKRKSDTDPNNDTNLLSDSFPVKSENPDDPNSIGIEPYNPDDETPQKVADNGNFADGDNSGFKF